jgi:hypothetical protein
LLSGKEAEQFLQGMRQQGDTGNEAQQRFDIG